MHQTPKPNGPNGTQIVRDARGRFAQGTKGGPGNPHARAVGRLRSALLATVTPEDVAAVARKLLELSLDGNLAAAQLLLRYVVGSTPALLDRLVIADNRESTVLDTTQRDALTGSE